MRKSMTVTVALMMGTLANEIENMESKIGSYRQNILRLREFIGEIDAQLGMLTKEDVVGTLAVDLHDDLQSIHQAICDGTPELPYDMRKDY